jgi:hypothetical protein
MFNAASFIPGRRASASAGHLSSQLNMGSTTSMHRNNNSQTFPQTQRRSVTPQQKIVTVLVDRLRNKVCMFFPLYIYYWPSLVTGRSPVFSVKGMFSADEQCNPFLRTTCMRFSYHVSLGTLWSISRRTTRCNQPSTQLLSCQEIHLTWSHGHLLSYSICLRRCAMEFVSLCMPRMLIEYALHL